MRTAAVPLLLALVCALASGSALAFKGGGGKSNGGGGGFKSSGGLNKSRVHHGHHGHHHGHHGHHRHHHHGHKSVTFVGVGFASPWPWSWYYPAYPYYPQPVVYETQPTTYIEQGATPAVEPAPAGWWYYCDASRTYYPYVKECPSGWQRVPAVPPPPN